MDDSILIRASLRIERPADEVRAQYRDIDHHIRNNVHPSIRYQWEPAAAGERKIRTTFRILGVPQYDVSLLEDAEDGSFLIRYLEGTNAGMLLVHKFVRLGESATDVQLCANAPKTLGRRLLGPLFVVGARLVMKKALMEDKRDLERGSFVAGRAAGDFARAFALIQTPHARDHAAERLVLEAGALVAVADGSFDAAERDTLGRLAQHIGASEQLTAVVQRAHELAALAADERIGAEADRLGRALFASGAAQPGLAAAVISGLTSDGLSLGELAVLRRLASAAQLDEPTLAKLIEASDVALSGGAAGAV